MGFTGIISSYSVLGSNISDNINKGQTTAPQLSSSSIVKGVAVSPYDLVLDYFAKANQAGDIMTWGGSFDDFKNDTGSAYTLTDIFTSYGLQPVIIVHSDTPHEVNITQKRYIEYYCNKYQPTYFGIGNEVNGLSLYNNSVKGPERYTNFTLLFNETYDLIKAVSPNTKIFTIFQLEFMKGLQGGLFAGKNDTATLNDWALMSNASKADFFAFTTYPCMIYQDPSLMPSDYYTEILTHTDKPIAFTEIGWYNGVPKEAGWAPWNSTIEEEANFIDLYFELTEDAETLFDVWPFIYNITSQVPFDRMWLLNRTEDTSLAWEAWLRAGTTPDDVDDDDDDDDDDDEITIPGYGMSTILFITITSMTVLMLKMLKYNQKWKNANFH